MDIPCRTFGTAKRPRLLITAGVHGDEFESIAAVRRLIELFQSEDQRVTPLAGQVQLVPVVNQAAFLGGHRTAEDDLDLARVCPGRSDGSVTEQTAAALSEMIRAADYYIDLHTGGTEFSVLPLAGYTLHADPAVRQTQQRMARAFNLPIVWGTAGNLDGRSLSVARDANVPAIYAEYLGAAICTRDGVEAYVQGCLNVLGELGLTLHTTATNHVEHDIQDPRPGSGHLQVCHPAPITGMFEPAISLGARIEVGEPLGVVRDLLGREQHTIPAEQTGLVLMLRTFPRVRAGESVGVVLELE